MMMGGGWLIGLLVLLLFLLLIGVGVAAAVWFARQPPPSGGRPTMDEYQEGRALDILRRRYARGEITREEFERIREDIRS